MRHANLRVNSLHIESLKNDINISFALLTCTPSLATAEREVTHLQKAFLRIRELAQRDVRLPSRKIKH